MVEMGHEEFGYFLQGNCLRQNCKISKQSRDSLIRWVGVGDSISACEECSVEFGVPTSSKFSFSPISTLGFSYSTPISVLILHEPC